MGKYVPQKRMFTEEQMNALTLTVSFVAAIGIFLFVVFDRALRHTVLARVPWREINLEEEVAKQKGRPLKIVFLHPDLGIGGAENLVVNAAVAMIQAGHNVTIYTAHHDPTHCFEETRGEGVLAKKIRVHGDWLPRTIFGSFYKLCTIWRMLYASFIILLRERRVDAYFVDQESISVGLLRVFSSPVLFYCHFPDQLLVSNNNRSASVLNSIYRGIVDALEEMTTGAADLVVVNSNFTREIFRKTFVNLTHVSPLVLYPPINEKTLLAPSSSAAQGEGEALTILSINRFERKKNIQLAVHALKGVKDLLPAAIWERVKLVLSGGYDPQNQENKEYFEELQTLVKDLNLQDRVEFRPSVSNEEKNRLLQTARFVVYTPENEHFGIVPIEAMYAGKPVVAVNSGGPTESVIDGETGFLCEPEPKAFAVAFAKLISFAVEEGEGESRRDVEMGKAGHKRVKAVFTLEGFQTRLDAFFRQLVLATEFDQLSWINEKEKRSAEEKKREEEERKRQQENEEENTTEEDSEAVNESKKDQ